MLKFSSVIRNLALILALLPCGVNAQTIKLHVSSKGGDRIAAKPDVQFSEAKPGDGAPFEINDAVKYQRMDGFGASFMEAGLMTLNTLPPEKQEAVLRAMFDVKEGAGFTAMKTPRRGRIFKPLVRGSPTTTTRGMSS